MQDKDKLILAVYVNVATIDRAKATEVLYQVKSMLNNTFDESVKYVIFPTTGDTHIDVLTPKYILTTCENGIITNTEYIPENINEQITKTTDNLLELL